MSQVRSPLSKSAQLRQFVVSVRAARRASKALLSVVLLAALACAAIPIAPVLVNVSTVSWPAAGEPVESTMMTLLPYRPLDLRVSIPCEQMSQAEAASEADPAAGVLFATFPIDGRAAGQGLTASVRDGRVLVVSEQLSIWDAPLPSAGCALHIVADGLGTSVLLDATVVARAVVEPPRVAVLATSLPPDTAGLRATVRTDSRFETSASLLKRCLLLLASVAAVLSLVLLRREDRPQVTGAGPVRARTRWLRAPDACLVAVLGVWAVIGPTASDDGYKVAVAEGYDEGGVVGNRYFWYNAPESPFGLLEQALVPLVELTHAPVLLRLPSVVAAILTWLLVDRVLLSRIREYAERSVTRWIALVVHLGWWLPFNLNLRAEWFVALASALVLVLVVLALERRTLTFVSLAVVAAALSLAVSPAGLIASAPLLVLGGRLIALLRDGELPGWLAAAALATPGAVTFVIVVFADQSLAAVLEATRVHRVIGPATPWWEEITRYSFLFSSLEMGGVNRRVAVLTVLGSLLFVMAALRRKHPDSPLDLVTAAAGCVAWGLVLLALVPSKWTHHFGGLAAFATVLLVGVLLRSRPALERGLSPRVATAAAAGCASVLVAASYAGPNQWWRYSSFGVDPQLPAVLRSPLLWLSMGALTVVAVSLLRRRRDVRTVTARHLATRLPAATVVLALVASVVGMLATHIRATVALSETWSMASQNVGHLTGEDCGMAEHVAVLQATTLSRWSGLTQAGEERLGQAFTRGGGSFAPRPSNLPADARHWGSFGAVTAEQTPESVTGSFTSEWFVVPELIEGEELGLFASGRTGGENAMVIEYASSAAPDQVVGSARVDSLDGIDWRYTELTSAAGADLVRVVMVDAATGAGGWIASTQPLLMRPQELSTVLGSAAVTVDWQILFAFPCVRQPVLAHGLAETPEFALSPEPAVRAEDFTGLSFAEFNGGALALARQVAVPAVVPTRLRGEAGAPAPQIEWGSLIRFTYPYPSGRYDLDVDAQSMAGTTWGYRYPIPVPPDPRRPSAPRVDKG